MNMKPLTSIIVILLLGSVWPPLVAVDAQQQAKKSETSSRPVDSGAMEEIQNEVKGETPERPAISAAQSSEVICLNAPWDPGLTRYPETYERLNNGQWIGHGLPRVNGPWGAVDFLSNDVPRDRPYSEWNTTGGWNVRAAHSGVARFLVTNTCPNKPYKTDVEIVDNFFGIKTQVAPQGSVVI